MTAEAMQHTLTETPCHNQKKLYQGAEAESGPVLTRQYNINIEHIEPLIISISTV